MENVEDGKSVGEAGWEECDLRPGEMNSVRRVRTQQTEEYSKVRLLVTFCFVLPFGNYLSDGLVNEINAMSATCLHTQKLIPFMKC